jgi:two-component system, chemotaxis family, protein-glutamate methylesterase/glutaminase
MEKEQVNGSKRLLIIGGSSGSLDALLVILPLLEKALFIPVILILHRNNSAGNTLTELLANKTLLKVKEADEKDMLTPGYIYIAPPDYHLLVEDDHTLSLDVSEKVNYCRPSIDVSFSSAAMVYRGNLTAILLSGANADGAEGLKMVKELGGFTIVQDPADAQVSYMPDQAIQLVKVDRVLSAKKIGELLREI